MNNKQKIAGLVITVITLAAAAHAQSRDHVRKNHPVTIRTAVVQVGPPTTYLKEGLSADEVLMLLGKPVSVSQHDANGQVVSICVFQRGEGRVLLAEFVNGILIHSRTEDRRNSAPVAAAGN